MRNKIEKINSGVGERIAKLLSLHERTKAR